MQAGNTSTSLNTPSKSASDEKRRKSPRQPRATQHELLQLHKKAGAQPTKKAILELLKAAGFKSCTGTVEDYLRIPSILQSGRNQRLNRRFTERFGIAPSTPPKRLASKARSLPAGTPAQRLEQVRQQTLERYAHQNFRLGAAGGSSIQVRFAQTSSEVAYEVEMRSNRNTYGGSFKGWLANEDHHRICIPRDWRTRVERRGLAILGGLLTLDLHPLEGMGEDQVFAAVWARQGRGYSVVTERGYLALGGGEHFHGDSPASALAGLQRKLSRGSQPAVPSLMSIGIEDFIARMQQHECTWVSLDDARATGACEYGISSWCEAVGIDIRQERVPMKQLLEGFRVRPQPEVRRAACQAVRAARAATRAASCEDSRCRSHAS